MFEEYRLERLRKQQDDLLSALRVFPQGDFQSIVNRTSGDLLNWFSLQIDAQIETAEGVVFTRDYPAMKEKNLHAKSIVDKELANKRTIEKSWPRWETHLAFVISLIAFAQPYVVDLWHLLVR